MKTLGAVLTFVCLLGSLAVAQDPSDIRNPIIDTESAEGGLITQAGLAEEAAEKIQYLEAFADKYSEHPAIGYVYLQLQGLYGDQNPDKVIDYGSRLLKIVPDDVEVRHNITKAYEASQKWNELLPHLIETKPLAEKEAAKELPEEYDEDEEAAHEAAVEYAQGVVQYVEYSLYTSLLKVQDPQTKLTYMDTLREHYPEGKYAKSLGDQYVATYQQLGDYEKMFAAMKEALDANPTNEQYIYALAENHFRKNEYDQANALGERLIQVIEQKPMPEGQTEEVWAKHKALFTAYGNFVLGRTLVAQNKFRAGRKLLLTTVEPLKEQGGQPYGTLAYFLGVCYVKLDIGGDNIRTATRWMTVASQTESPYQAEAKKTLAAIKQATQ